MCWYELKRMAKQKHQATKGQAVTTTMPRRQDDRGMSQLTLVEHALCPLDRRVALCENLRHESEYRYVDAAGHRQTAQVVVHCPAGLSAGDEYYLWGLLALTFAQPDPRPEFHATPHFCLRKLGLICPDSKGGKSYRLFRDALRRLSAVHYQNEQFFDPIRREHRVVSFGLLSYSLPMDAESPRAWRIVWDAMFFEFCKAAGGQLSFDLELYRRLDHASRRLFLLLSKVFWRSRLSPRFDLRHLAVHGLGFSAHLPSRTLKSKVRRCAEVLEQHHVLGTPTVAEPLFHKQGKERCRVRFIRGTYFECRHPSRMVAAMDDSPLYDPLRALGLEPAAIRWILNRFPVEQIQLWADVTLAALEHKGRGFFRRSPAAFFVDNIQNAARGERTPPDWFWAIRKQEQRRNAERARRKRDRRPPIGQNHTAPHSVSTYRALNLDQDFDSVVTELTAHFVAGGQTEADALRNAQRFAEESVRSRRPRRPEQQHR